jgi:hypothetical protein
MIVMRKWRANRTALTGIVAAIRIRNSPSAVKRKG